MKRSTCMIIVLACLLVLIVGCTTGRATVPPPRPSSGAPVGGGCGVGAPGDLVIDVGEGVVRAIKHEAAA